MRDCCEPPNANITQSPCPFLWSICDTSEHEIGSSLYMFPTLPASVFMGSFYIQLLLHSHMLMFVFVCVINRHHAAAQRKGGTGCGLQLHQRGRLPYPGGEWPSAGEWNLRWWGFTKEAFNNWLINLVVSCWINYSCQEWIALAKAK